MRVLLRLHVLDRVAIGLLVIGLLCVATGLLPTGSASDAMTRIAPLLPFLGTVIVLAELTSRAEVFDVLAARMARAGRGSYPLLFLLCVAFASVTTIALNLDTTAVLLTPVMLALASRVGIAPVPLAMTTVWLANTASLLLPVSNLTNLLAANRVALSPLGLAGRMWAPQLAAVAVTMACLWLFFWRRGRRGAEEDATGTGSADLVGVSVSGPGAARADDVRPRATDRYAPPEVHSPADPVLFRACALACAGFLLAILVADVPLWTASATAAAVAVAAFAVRRPSVLRPSLIPWRLLVMVPGMFLVVETVNAHGLHDLLASAVGHDGGVLGMFRAAAVGGGLSNALNNLPVYLAGEAAVPVANHDQLLALLVGTNAGPVITPWASLATLLWYERCHAYGVRVPVARLMGTGAVLATAAVVTSVTALALTR
ncbi:Na+/H+ antiporter NhaD/arsenite permease-like protein [Streptomyces griseochromogenes]|uniref:Arsenic transporter n=1 Tax=Streptomyces griseochromogenes TaxID=68214 RepID=A0A1B1AT95_9ACTN|nr:SLC13 family permease [Streptomyces griseochromogenes]ANP49793.1 arsenic transporter [Streptomyces griseochromogenes]MBP2051719.1 Na+/H+ antiporter NhaD/arsenite permease-like protein [Streptomyces griseochromogenes]